jgi:hypothetical protein
MQIVFHKASTKCIICNVYARKMIILKQNLEKLGVKTYPGMKYKELLQKVGFMVSLMIILVP